MKEVVGRLEKRENRIRKSKCVGRERKGGGGEKQADI